MPILTLSLLGGACSSPPTARAAPTTTPRLRTESPEPTLTTAARLQFRAALRQHAVEAVERTLQTTPGVVSIPLPPDHLPPLHLTADAGHADLATLLIERGALADRYADLGDGEMAPAAFLAFRRPAASLELLRALEEAGANLRLRSSAGRTLLIAACTARASVPVLNRILQSGVPIDGSTGSGATALHAAVIARSAHAVEFLLASGANRDATIKGIGTARDIAAAALLPPSQVNPRALREYLARHGLSGTAMSPILAALDQ